MNKNIKYSTSTNFNSLLLRFLYHCFTEEEVYAELHNNTMAIRKLNWKLNSTKKFCNFFHSWWTYLWYIPTLIWLTTLMEVRASNTLIWDKTWKCQLQVGIHVCPAKTYLAIRQWVDICLSVWFVYVYELHAYLCICKEHVMLWGLFVCFASTSLD